MRQKRRKVYSASKKTIRGFTLVELLVVMAIMSMLMSILMPALSGARQQSHQLHCLTNLRTLTFAWLFYAQDNDDVLCSPETCRLNADSGVWVADEEMMPGNSVGGTEEAMKKGALWRYVETVKLYRCKSQRNELVRGYSISRAMRGSTCGCASEWLRPFNRIGEITSTSERIVFADADSQAEWIDGSFWPAADLAAQPVWNIRVNHNISARHNEGSNFSFADGHCEYRKWKDQRTVRLANWETVAGASDNNADMEWLISVLKGR
jgi:prepilin-type N-terminal cleavage/methylation domain-containing protein/prepilin-type processing-associated H-X9-DG protein